MKTNEIKKGMVVKLRNGWYGIMADNMKGNTRMVDVDGLYREMGSVYSHDIILVWPNFKLKQREVIDFEEHEIYEPSFTRLEHTKPQLDLKLQVDRFY